MISTGSEKIKKVFRTHDFISGNTLWYDVEYVYIGQGRANIEFLIFFHVFGCGESTNTVVSSGGQLF